MPKVRASRNQLSRRPSCSNPLVFCNYTVAVRICDIYLAQRKPLYKNRASVPTGMLIRKMGVCLNLALDGGCPYQWLRLYVRFHIRSNHFAGWPVPTARKGHGSNFSENSFPPDRFAWISEILSEEK